MIAKDTTTTVNFFVTDTDGFPATGQASNITATISINGATATSISDTITEKGSGWYYFNHTFGTAGNAFITFTAANCVIMPWEEEVVEMASGSLTAQQVWEYSGGRTITNTIPSAANIADAVWDEDITAHIDTRNKPLGYMVFYMDYIPQSVWGYSVKYVSLSQNTITDIWSMSTFPDEDDIAARVWGRTRNAAPTRTLTAATLSNGSLSTFNPLNDTVLIDSTQAATMVTATGFATPSDLTGLSTFDPATDRVLIDATQAATMTTATGFATPSDLAGLSTFDPSTDTVLIDSTQAATMTTATGFATPSDLAGLSTFDPTNDTVLIDSTQAAGMATATGFATPSDVANAAAELEIYGDAHWYGDGITARDVWTYTGPRTLTASPTDISSLATKTDLTSAKTAIIGAMPDVSGLSTFNPATDTVLIDATQVADFATSSDISTAQEAIINAVEGIDLSGLATSTDTAVLNAELQELIGGVMNWYVTANTLTIYSPSNTVIRTYSITRDPEGNITRIQPNNG